MKVLVPGAGGQLGREAVPCLRKAGFEVVALDSLSLDITRREKVLATMAHECPEIIINCAAYTQVDRAEQESEKAHAVNAVGVKYLAEASSELGSLLVHISTDFVFDGYRSIPYAETDKPNPLSVYGESKLRGEEEVCRLEAKNAIVRTSWLYGSQGNNFVKTILRLASEREVLRVVCDQVGTPTWTFDLAKAVSAIATQYRDGGATVGICHFSNEGVASWYDFAMAIVEEARILGNQLKCEVIEPIPTSGYPTPARRPAYSVLDKRKIKDQLGLTIPHWRVSLRSMLRELVYGNTNA